MKEVVETIADKADISTIIKREEEVALLIKSINDILNTSPHEKIRVSISNGTPQYYARVDNKDKIGTYIKKKDREFARKLANKKYYEELLMELIKEEEILSGFINTYKNVSEAAVFNKLDENIKTLISPIIISDEEYAAKWLKEIYTGKPINDELQYFVTDRNEKVRSKSELIIANTLNKNGIPYKYERPLKVNRYIFYPDFTVLNVKKRKEIYYEHLGMMGNEEYSTNSVWKINQYINAGLIPGKNVVFTQETAEYPLNQKVLQKVIDSYFK